MTGDVDFVITASEAGVTYELTIGGTPLTPAVSQTSAGGDLTLTLPSAQVPSSNESYTIIASIDGCADVALLDPADLTINAAPDNSLAVSDAVECNPSTGDVDFIITASESGVN